MAFWSRSARMSVAITVSILASDAARAVGDEPASPPSAAVDEQPAGLQYPLGVAAATDGTLVVADRLLPGLWRVAEGRPALLFAGSKRFRTPLNAVRAVAVAPDGTVYAGDSATREVYRIPTQGEPKPLTGGAIGIPVDIAIDSSGRLFVSDLETQRVWRIDPEKSEPVEVATLAAPRGLFVDGKDRLWVVAASGEAPLVRVAADGTVEPVVTTRAFSFPHDVVVDDGGVAYVSDNYAHCIWRVSADGTPEKWVDGAPLVGPVGLSMRDGNVLVADPRARQVFSIDPSKRVVPVITGAHGGPPGGRAP